MFSKKVTRFTKGELIDGRVNEGTACELLLLVKLTNCELLDQLI